MLFVAREVDIEEHMLLLLLLQLGEKEGKGRRGRYVFLLLLCKEQNSEMSIVISSLCISI